MVLKKNAHTALTTIAIGLMVSVLECTIACVTNGKINQGHLSELINAFAYNGGTARHLALLTLSIFVCL